MSHILELESQGPVAQGMGLVLPSDQALQVVLGRQRVVEEISQRDHPLIEHLDVLVSHSSADGRLVYT